MYMYVLIDVYASMYGCASAYLPVHVYVYAFDYMYAYASVYVPVHVYAMWLILGRCLCMHTPAHAHTHIHT